MADPSHETATKQRTITGPHRRAPIEPVYRPATVVDGDTIALANGQSVRVVGIDTPESGVCGSQQATALTARLIRGGIILKTAKTENTDHYGRLLRYVRTRWGDLGTILLRRGLAVARYDATDGYGWHRQQAKYQRIDDATAQVCPTPTPRPTRTPTPPPAAAPQPDPGGRCDPNYKGACVPISQTDLDCADIDGSVIVVDSDVHGFDADGDTYGCESN